MLRRRQPRKWQNNDGSVQSDRPTEPDVIPRRGEDVIQAIREERRRTPRCDTPRLPAWTCRLVREVAKARRKRSLTRPELQALLRSIEQALMWFRLDFTGDVRRGRPDHFVLVRASSALTAGAMPGPDIVFDENGSSAEVVLDRVYLRRLFRSIKRVDEPPGDPKERRPADRAVDGYLLSLSRAWSTAVGGKIRWSVGSSGTREGRVSGPLVRFLRLALLGVGVQMTPEAIRSRVKSEQARHRPRS